MFSLIMDRDSRYRRPPHRYSNPLNTLDMLLSDGSTDNEDYAISGSDVNPSLETGVDRSVWIDELIVQISDELNSGQLEEVTNLAEICHSMSDSEMKDKPDLFSQTHPHNTQTTDTATTNMTVTDTKPVRTCTTTKTTKVTMSPPKNPRSGMTWFKQAPTNCLIFNDREEYLEDWFHYAETVGRNPTTGLIDDRQTMEAAL